MGLEVLLCLFSDVFPRSILILISDSTKQYISVQYKSSKKVESSCSYTTPIDQNETEKEISVNIALLAPLVKLFCPLFYCNKILCKTLNSSRNGEIPCIAFTLKRGLSPRHLNYHTSCLLSLLSIFFLLLTDILCH